VLTTLLIATTISGCSLFKDNLVEPLCLPSRPVLQDVSIEQQRTLKDADSEAFSIVATNDLLLKQHIVTIEAITDVHNNQFKAKCAEAEL
jgi:hypothetical protein